MIVVREDFGTKYGNILYSTKVYDKAENAWAELEKTLTSIVEQKKGRGGVTVEVTECTNSVRTLFWQVFMSRH